MLVALNKRVRRATVELAQCLHQPMAMRSDPSAQLSGGCTVSVLTAPDTFPAEATLTCAGLLGQARQALKRYQDDPASFETWVELMEAMRSAAASVAKESRCQGAPRWWDEASTLLVSMLESGVHERLAVEDIEPVPYAKSWLGAVARMLLRPAWEGSFPPALDSIPEWMWETYGKWLFARPGLFAAHGQVDSFAHYRESLVSELGRWSDANPRAAVVQLALRFNQEQENAPALRASAGDLRKYFETVARIAVRSDRASVSSAAPVTPFARDGRRLRVAIVVAALDGSSEALAAMPLCTQLDPERFETLVYLECSKDTPWERQCRKITGNLLLLSPEHSNRLIELSSASADVIVFAADLSAASGGLRRMAQHRLAPLQVITAGQSWATSGLSTVDLFVAGALTEIGDSGHEFRERVGFVPGPARAFDHSLVPAAGGSLTRAEAGLPEAGVLLMAVADWREILPGTMIEWAQLLAAAPGTSLLLQRADTGSAGFDREFCAAFDRVLGEHGVDGKRLIISPTPLPVDGALQALLSLADILLDAQPSLDERAALFALKAGVPVVTIEGGPYRSRRVAALLRSLGLEELVAQTTSGYAAIARRLIGHADERIALSGRIGAMMAASPAALDPLAAGDAFGDLIELAFDHIVDGGNIGFVTAKSPLMVPPDSVALADRLQAGAEALVREEYYVAVAEARAALRAEPASAPARALLGRALLGIGIPRRATDYLLASVDAPGADGALWRDLALAFERSGRSAEAIQALETSLRLNPACPVAWVRMIEFAERGGAIELARDGLGMLTKIQPDHPEIAALTIRLNAAGIVTEHAEKTLSAAGAHSKVEPK